LRERHSADVADWIELCAELCGVEAPGVDAPVQAAPDDARRTALGALAEFFSHDAGERPALLILEDLHWIDDTSNELVEILVGLCSELKLLLLVTTRPGPTIT
jgi:predicted ATPase